ncbi:MAG TPA: hypothetical protein VE911_12230 [Candidatus Nitrosopolaris sp.]|nr:hypothetical protein [Candidatus Nitrosopolaris sp.]
MRRCGVRLFASLAVLAVLGVGRALAEEAAGGEPAASTAEKTSGSTAPWSAYQSTATVAAGYRLVDIDGSKDKYREDYNLRSGGRLFLFTLDSAAREPDKAPLDRFHLEVDTPGDEPASRFVLDAADRALWDLRVDFNRSKYFYEVPRLFDATVPGDLRLDDLHDFDLTRTNGIAELRLHPKDLPTLILGYRLYQLEGDGTSTVLVPGGGNFLVQAPQRQVTNVGSIGTEFTALGTGFFLEQQYRRVSRTYGLHGPLDPKGLDPAQGFTLTSWQSVEDDHIDIPITRVRVSRPVGDRIELTGGYVYAHASLDENRTRFRDGTSTIPSDNGPSTRVDSGDASLDTQLADLGASVRLTSIATLHLDYRYDDRSQDGDLDALLDPGQLQTSTRFHVRLNRVTSDVEVRPTRSLALSAGIQYARRDAAFSLANQDISTDLIGAVAEGRWQPERWVDFFFRYDNVQIDDPWTIPGNSESVPALPSREIAYTFQNRGKMGFHLRPRDWLQVSYDFTADSFENSDFQGRVQRFANTASVSVTPVAGLTAVAGYTRRDLNTRNQILIAPRYQPTGSVQSGSEDVVTSTLTYDFKFLDQPWSTGWNLAWIRSDSKFTPSFEPGLPPRGPYDLDRIDAGAFLAFHHPFIEPGIEVRRISYSQNPLSRNDYDATIAEFRLTRRFNF